MNPHYRPRRSMLHLPGSTPRYLEKARDLPVDSLIFDLEDPVLPVMKEEARRNVAEAIRQGGYGRRERVVRINGLDTPWGADDLKAAAGSGVDAILFPEIESRADVLTALKALDAAGGAHLPIMVQVETPLGVLHAEEIAGASERIACMVMGTTDLVNALHAQVTLERLPLLYSLSHCLLAARAHGISIIDGIHSELKDMHAFETACRLGCELGFDGKALIHPYQISFANDAFTPKKASLDHARRIIAAMAEANAVGCGVAVVNGRLVESLHVESAKRLLAVDEMIEKLGARGG